MIGMQTRALLVDAYRDLNSRKLFWIVLILNVLVVAGFAALGVKGNRMTVFAWEIPQDIPVIPGAMFVYKWIFSYIIVGQWLTWIATILALISTASIFPDFLAGGAVELYLSKPIGRLRLFLTKYLSGLLFVTLQVTVFTIGGFLVLGWRGKVWEPGLFLAIPIVVLFFSYLFSMCVLFGIWTRSTLAAFFLTLVAWALIFGLNAADRFLLQADQMYLDRAQWAQRQVAQADKDIAAAQARLDRLKAQATTAPTTSSTSQSQDDAESRLREARFRRQRFEGTAQEQHPPDWVKKTQPVIFVINTVIPKTRETVGLLDRILFSDVALRAALAQAPEGRHPSHGWRSQIQDMLHARNMWWIIGSSVAFEAILLAIAARRFCRSDY